MPMYDCTCSNVLVQKDIESLPAWVRGVLADRPGAQAHAGNPVFSFELVFFPCRERNGTREDRFSVRDDSPRAAFGSAEAAPVEFLVEKRGSKLGSHSP